MAINGDGTIFNAYRHLVKNGPGETVAVFQNLLSKLPYFKHKHKSKISQMLHKGQETKSEI